MYLAWYDASRKLSIEDKIANAWARYEQKFILTPTEVLLNPVDANKVTEPLPLTLRPMDNISPNTFWIGTPEDNT